MSAGAAEAGKARADATPPPLRRSAERLVSAATTGRDRGAVAAETAAVLPLLVAVAVGLVWLVSVAATQVRVVDATREVARVAARGESDAAALGYGRRVAPERTTFTVTRGPDRVRVSASVVVRGPGGIFGFLPGVTVSADSIAAREPR